MSRKTVTVAGLVEYANKALRSNSGNESYRRGIIRTIEPKKMPKIDDISDDELSDCLEMDIEFNKTDSALGGSDAGMVVMAINLFHYRFGNEYVNGNVRFMHLGDNSQLIGIIEE